MMETKKLPDETALAFYSKVSASISHELKNSLAVINESAGFLEDIILMAQKGRPLDPNQIGALAGTVLKQVQRSNTIIKNMNRLAHSLDEKRSSIELIDLLELMTCLVERTAVNKGVKISTTFPETRINLTTCPFYLQTLVWLVLEYSMAACGVDKTIGLGVTQTNAGARIYFSGLKSVTSGSIDDFFSGRLESLLAVLKADLTISESDGRLEFLLPASVPEIFES